MMALNNELSNEENPFYENYNNVQRPSIFHSPQKHVQFSSVASNPTYSMPAQFSPLVAPMNGTPWKCNWMPTPNPQNGPHQFTSSPNQFTATQNPFSQTTPNPFDSSRLPFKRKAMPDMDLPTCNKKLITEEIVTADMNSLHISSDYKAHATNEASDMMQQLEEIATSNNVKLSPLELDIQEKLRRAERITVCEEVAKICDEPILPKSILERYERPCQALVVWQPPKKVEELIAMPSECKTKEENSEIEDCEIDELDNNSEPTIQFDSMDLDM